MIIQTTKEINGVLYDCTYSDSGYMIERDGAAVQPSKALILWSLTYDLRW